MDQDAARTAKESLELVFLMSYILGTGLDRHTLSVLIAICDLGLKPKALAVVVKRFCMGWRAVLYYCLKSFAKAPEVAPYTLAKNTGLNPNYHSDGASEEACTG
ncbi:atGCP3 interacting protein 1 [Artemisia annua]|uniref:AtGCP3 interacting protein 1 n=1 Tax=Artemisia annua TaxID=35608 RepID=A0A2U1LXX7_ARTAN|nr:atGCP3 interacting protein 1 [Artemisia annua]